jgi:hypothetical protein
LWAENGPDTVNLAAFDAYGTHHSIGALHSQNDLLLGTKGKFGSEECDVVILGGLWMEADISWWSLDGC